MTTSNMREKHSRLTPLRLWVSAHKFATIVVVLLLIAIGGVVALNVSSYLHKFSKADYDQLTAMAATVLKESGGKDIQISRTCSYNRPGEFSNLHLYCGVEMVTYLEYGDDGHAIKIAGSLQREIEVQFGQLDFKLSRFYTSPRNGSDTATVNLKPPFPKAQCNFYIQSNRNAKKVLSFPEQNDDNLIALSFECSAESRAEYFPVTYRQG